MTSPERGITPAQIRGGLDLSQLPFNRNTEAEITLPDGSSDVFSLDRFPYRIEELASGVASAEDIIADYETGILSRDQINAMFDSLADGGKFMSILVARINLLKECLIEAQARRHAKAQAGWDSQSRLAAEIPGIPTAAAEGRYGEAKARIGHERAVTSQVGKEYAEAKILEDALHRSIQLAKDILWRQGHGLADQAAAARMTAEIAASYHRTVIEQMGDVARRYAEVQDVIDDYEEQEGRSRQGIAAAAGIALGAASPESRSATFPALPEAIAVTSDAAVVEQTTATPLSRWREGSPSAGTGAVGRASVPTPEQLLTLGGNIQSVQPRTRKPEPRDQGPTAMPPQWGGQR
jgi:hypothetical protein